METFIAIVPPQEYADKIAAFQNRFNCGDPLVGPHITVKAPSALTQDLKWLPKVEAVCKNFPRFEIVLGQPEKFFTNVLYLSVHSPEISALHRQLVKAVTPTPEQIKQYFELDDYVPHLTLAMLRDDLEEIEAEAVQELAPYPTFTAHSLRIFTQTEENGVFKILRDIPFAEV